MQEVDQLADALFERFRRFMALALAQQPGDLRTLPDRVEQLAPVSRTLNEWLEIYEGLLQQRGYNPQTVKNRRSNLVHVRRLWGDKPLREIRPRHISDALQHFLPDRASTARRICDELRDIFIEAVANDWCDTNPVLNMRKPQGKVKRKRLALETWDSMCELAMVHRQAWVMPMLLLALVTAQRRADLGKMQFDHVWDGHLHIEQQKRAGKEFGARVALPLTLRLDVVGITLGEVIELCRHYSPPGPTLLRRGDGKSIELSSLSTRFNELIREVCGKDAYKTREWPSLHEVRSLSERIYREQGIQTQHLLGHKHQEMTDKYNDDRGLTAAAWKHLRV